MNILNIKKNHYQFNKFQGIHLHIYVVLNSSLWISITSQSILKSFCSILTSSVNSLVTTVACLGWFVKIDSPNDIPTPKVHNVTSSCSKYKYFHYIFLFAQFRFLFIFSGFHKTLNKLEAPRSRHCNIHCISFRIRKKSEAH